MPIDVDTSGVASHAYVAKCRRNRRGTCSAPGANCLKLSASRRDDLRGLEQICSNKIGSSPGRSARPIGRYPYRRRPGRAAKLDVRFLVADHNRRIRAESQLGSGPLQQAWSRFSAGTTRVRGVGTAIDPLKSGAQSFHHGIQSGIHRCQVFEREKTPADAGLIAGDDETVSV